MRNIMAFLSIIGLGYVAPALIAEGRRHRRAKIIAVLNVTLGWTIIGWVIALWWATGDNVLPEEPTWTE